MYTETRELQRLMQEARQLRNEYVAGLVRRGYHAVVRALRGTARSKPQAVLAKGNLARQ